jgi:hypothetical protein
MALELSNRSCRLAFGDGTGHRQVWAKALELVT